MGGEDAGEALCFGLYHRLERVASKGALLLQVGADILDFIIRDSLT
jgi:hypothetical protein